MTQHLRGEVLGGVAGITSDADQQRASPIHRTDGVGSLAKSTSQEGIPRPEERRSACVHLRPGANVLIDHEVSHRRDRKAMIVDPEQSNAWIGIGVQEVAIDRQPVDARERLARRQDGAPLSFEALSPRLRRLGGDQRRGPVAVDPGLAEGERSRQVTGSDAGPTIGSDDD
jgi:hypothetical protein